MCLYKCFVKCLIQFVYNMQMSRKRNRIATLQYIGPAEYIQKVMKFVFTGSYQISRRSLKEVESEEKRIAEEHAKLEAEKAALKERHQGRRYREGSFDNGDSPARPSLDPLNSVGRIDR